MSVLYLQFENGDRNTRVQKLSKSGAHIVPVEPRWPIFFELAKKEKPYLIAIDFSQAPSHCLETADYLAKAKETRETPLYLLRVPDDRLEAVKKRLPNAGIVTEQDLLGLLVVEEKKAQEHARKKREAAPRSFIERLFGVETSKGKALRLLAKAQTWTAQVYGPLGELAQGVIKASWESYQGLRGILSFVEPPSMKQVFTFYEYFFFFLHMVFRIAHQQGFSEGQMQRLQAYLGPVLTGTAIDTFFKHWPDSKKTAMRNEMFENLNRAEGEYAACSVMFVKGNPWETESSFGRVALNVAAVWDRSSNPLVLAAAKMKALEAFARFPLDEVLARVATVIDQVDPQTLREMAIALGQS